MKKIIISLTAIVIIGACKKEVQTQAQKVLPSFSTIISVVVLPPDANEEVKRIAEAVYNPDFTFGLTDNPNYGSFSSTPQYDIFMSGSTPPTIGLKLDGTAIHQDNGQWLQQSIDFKNYYGKAVDVEITNNSVSVYSGTVYVPKPAKAPLLNADLKISRTGNMLTWEVDPDNPANKIALAYSLYSTSGLNDMTGEVDRGVLLIDNNGSFNIDALLLNTEVKKIYFRLVSGNAIAVDVDGQKVLFTIKTYDHHIYMIE